MFFPSDIWRLIFAYLALKDLLSIFQTCHTLKRLLFLQLKQEKFRICGTELYTSRPSQLSLLSKTQILEEENNVLENGRYTLREIPVIKTSGVYFLIQGEVEFLGEVVLSIHEGKAFKIHASTLSIYGTLHVLGLGPHFQVIILSGGGHIKIDEITVENLKPCNLTNCPNCSEGLIEITGNVGNTGPIGPIPDPRLRKSQRRRRKENKKILKYNSHRSDQRR